MTGQQEFKLLQVRGPETGQLSGATLLIVKADKTNAVPSLIGLLDLEFCVLFSHVHIGVMLVPMHEEGSHGDCRLVIITVITQQDMWESDTVKNLA